PPSPASTYTLSLHDALPIFSAQTRSAPVDRRQYRQSLPRGGVHGRERADRLGADPVRADLRGEPPRPVDHQPSRRILWSQLMNTDRKSTRLNSSHVSISYAV